MSALIEIFEFGRFAKAEKQFEAYARGLLKKLDPSGKIEKETIKKLRKESKEISPSALAKISKKFEMSAAWTRKEGKRASGGLNQKGVESYRRENPGSKLKTAVTRDPSKLKKGGKAAKRRASFCARMKGMKKRRTSAKTANDPNSRINKSLRAWNC